MLVYDYGKTEMSRDWTELRPDLLMYDVDIRTAILAAASGWPG